MKTFTILIVVCLCFGTIEAQKVIEKHIDFSGKESLSLNIQIADSISLHTWSKDEIYITVSANINDNTDNEAYTTTFDESGKTVSVIGKFKDNYFRGKNNCCDKSDIYWKIFVPANTGFSIETINANITIDGQTRDIKAKSISGYIDLAVPSDRQADLEFSTISGTMYSNHELALNKVHSVVPSKIVEKMNNGGAPIRLETISGDIFFRKSN